MATASEPTRADKQHALQEVLASQALVRSEQLKRFLRYVCELEIDGRGGEIKEYAIGTEALGRPATYSPVEDSSVRRRAFELRSKLEEIYRTELSESPVQVGLPKGSYVPVFHSRRPEVAPEPAQPAGAEPGSGISKWLTWPLAAALVLGILIGMVAIRRLGSSQGNELLREAWGPLLTQGDVLICLATPLQLMVRPGGFSPEADLPSFPAPEGVEAYFDQSLPQRDGAQLFMRPTLNSTTLGTLGAVVAASNRLQSFGVQSHILPERSAPLTSFRNRNVILVGDPLTSVSAAQLLSSARLTIALDPATHRMVIRDQTLPPGSPPAFSRAAALTGSVEVFGLLTVRPSDATPGQRRRTLIVSGVSNVGVQGAMEFFASAERMQQLKQRFQQDGEPGFPESYQVVVRCTARDSLPLSCDYAAHYVMPALPGQVSQK